ncbi:MAG: hypothetical protein Ct9H90mP20_7250 [Candidatus Neomarinimicrobiota bacterium]|nr:MAG: hypothetical protein Ct9H90mP20_7250 [Candidatus Neomarinimicrobiota bacterium]
MRKSVIHNDGNEIIFNQRKNETIGIIDFWGRGLSFTAMEPAVCLAYLLLEKGTHSQK